MRPDRYPAQAYAARANLEKDRNAVAEKLDEIRTSWTESAGPSPDRRARNPLA
ncbi:hypothetical protein OKJ48_32245 [Streptomyces kunmingensis]|uniref:Uncharacterized protein n=1 Tax=Streptomyces kunmingensis TaxID=68225 RepID=A0ABU6CKY4_9ACTN|nr:hypothetical protein [Streptomyces kunmingensis]MEB3964866.1 hypothetical protein [Streptomyces kunmingensis]